MKKILLGLGTLATIVAPLSTVIACGSENEKATQNNVNSTSDEVKNGDLKINTNNNHDSQKMSTHLKNNEMVDVKELKKILDDSKNSFTGEFLSIEKEVEFLELNDGLILDDEFKDSSSLLTISLPEIKWIGSSAFHNSLLTSLSLPKVEKIWTSAFYNSKLTSLSLPDVETIGSEAFYNSELTSLSLPEVETIGEHAFYYSKLTSLELPLVKKIEGNAFQNSPLISLSLPEVKGIGDIAFYGSHLTSLNIPNVETIGYHTFGLVNSPDTKVTLPKKFNTPEELAKIFRGPVDQVSFTWV